MEHRLQGITPAHDVTKSATSAVGITVQTYLVVLVESSSVNAPL